MSLSWCHPAAFHGVRVTAGRDPRNPLVQTSDLGDEESEARGLTDTPARVRTPPGASFSACCLGSGLAMDDIDEKSHLAEKLPAPSVWALTPN